MHLILYIAAYGKNGKDNARQIGRCCPPHIPGLLRQLLLLHSSDRHWYNFFSSIFEGSRGNVLNRTFQKIIILETKPLHFWHPLFARGIESNHCLQEWTYFSSGLIFQPVFSWWFSECCRAGGAGMPKTSQAFTGAMTVLERMLLHHKVGVLWSLPWLYLKKNPSSVQEFLLLSCIQWYPTSTVAFK